MNRILIFMAILIGAAGLRAQDRQPGSDSLKVMTYNLRFGELASMEAIAGSISRENPDVVMLQECDWATSRERAPHQNGVKFINVLASETGMFGLFGKSIDYRGGYYGLAILSRYPFVSSGRHLLPNDGSTEQRSLLTADIELPSGNMLTVACTHLEVSSPALRVRQVEFIDEYFRFSGHPVILAGDMNAVYESPEMDYLRKSWLDLSNRENTFSTKFPSIKIDYIYAKPETCLELLSTEVLYHIVLSDHFPVSSEFVLHRPPCTGAAQASLISK